MTVVLQYQFRDLKVTDKAFEVVLSFGGVLERLYVPLDSIKGFADPSVQFGLQFEALTLRTTTPRRSPTTPSRPSRTPSRNRKKTAAPAPAFPRHRCRSPRPERPRRTAAESKDDAKDPPDDKPGAEVVRLDRFRKK